MRRKIALILTTALLGSFAWSSTADAYDFTPGRFTGGGKFYSASAIAMTHGFELHCNVADGPNNLEVNWEGHQFHLEDLTWAACSYRTDPAPPVAPSNVYNGIGFGRLDGVSGAYAEWRIIDKGEPGTRDRMKIQVWDSQGGNLVIATSLLNDGSLLNQGNHQAHRETP